MTFRVVTLTKKIPEFLKAYPNLRLDLKMDGHKREFMVEGYDVASHANTRDMPDSSLVTKKADDEGACAGWLTRLYCTGWQDHPSRPDQ